MVQYSRSDIKKVSGAFDIEPFREKRKRKNDSEFRLIDVMDLGVYLIVPLLVGLGLGIVLDNKLGIKPIGVISGLFLGALGSFFNLQRIVREFSNHA